ncbi:MAG: ABC transporter substrate-binding protein [Chthonomonadaceae bacterium]|nr:ABC transporter substrate-binding protein [Chthonomonadaceae bacterium]
MKLSCPALVLALALMSVGCGPGRFNTENQAKAAGVFRYPIINNPTTMDPHKVQDGDTIDLLQSMYEGLVGWSPENKPVGYLAESWEISPDGKVYTFKLKTNAKFHNGRNVTSEDVKWSFERCSNPSIASPVADAYLSDIQGFTEKFKGQAKEVTGVKALDPEHVQITLKAPTRMFLGKLTYLGACIVPKESFPPDKEVSDIGQMIGCGPFKIKSYQPNQLIVLDAFADYHDGAPKLKSIERLVLQDAVTRLNKFKSGEIDLVPLERPDIPGIQSNEKYKDQIHYYPRPSTYYFAMNELMYPPFKDKRVKMAFGMAVDRKKIVDEVLSGINTVANNIVPPGLPGGGRSDAKFLPFDPMAAKKLLAEAGFEGGKGLPALTLTFREDKPDVRMAAESIANQVKANLGVDVKLQSMEWGAYLTKFNNKQQTFYHMRWAADYVDPENFLSHMLATWGPENKLGYNSPEFDRLCKLADSVQDMDKAVQIYAQAEDIALQDAAWVPIYFQRDAELISPRVKGLRESIFGHLPHTTTTVD